MANPKGIAINNQSILGTSSQQLNPLLTCNPPRTWRSHQFVNGSCFAVPTVPGTNGPNMLPATYGPWFFDSDLALFKNFKMSESRRLQIRMQAYNFLNHPLWSFPSGSNLTLQFNQDPVTQTVHTNQHELRHDDTKAGTTHRGVRIEVLLLAADTVRKAVNVGMTFRDSSMMFK